MRRTIFTLALLLFTVPAAGTATAADEPWEYRIEEASVELSTTQAGGHPDFTAEFRLSTNSEGVPFSSTKDVLVRLPAGLIGNPEAVPKCTPLQLGTKPEESECPQDSQVGSTDIQLAESGTFYDEPIYNMTVPGGDLAAKFGFFAGPYPVVINARLDPETNGIVAGVEGAASDVWPISVSTTFWGVPAHPSHDVERITPFEASYGGAPPEGRDSSLPEVPFLTNPTSCGKGSTVTVAAHSYQLPGQPSVKTVPLPQITGCGMVAFDPTTSLAVTTGQGTSSTGLKYQLELPTKGFEVANLNAGSHMNRVEVTLPEGMTVNASAAEGLGVCSEADYARERYDSLPNEGCPETSKIGSLLAESPVLDRDAVGSLYLARPYDNPFDSLLALYLVFKVPDRGVLVKLAGEVEPDARTGQLVTTFEDIPQLPVSTVSLSFREGARAPLVTPAACGSYDAHSKIRPWAKPAAPAERINSFAVTSGPNRGPCPSGGVPPFHPGFLAGSLHNTAGTYSPFNMRLTRQDEDQDATKFSAVLPPGMIGKLAGVQRCPEVGIALARSRSGPREGRLEQASPSCPPGSEIGNVLAGAGVGDILTYAAGKVYLAGPYNGAPLSVVGIVPAVAGPFDIGTVVTRQALRIDPRTAEVEVDGSSSDPIPHILAGIPLKVRDIRVYVDRPSFTLNPTSCEASSSKATLWGGGLDAFSTLDDMPFFATSRFQAAECGALAFKPRLGLKLRGATRRAGHPALRGVYRPRPGDANLERLVLRLPRSTFLEQAHIRTICTRVQFAAGGGNGRACPQGSIYGYAKAWTPLLDEPLQGPVFLRSSNHKLPDFVATLRGLVDVEVAARIDSVRGGIRAVFPGLPDAPITKVIVDMRGSKKGLIVNSTNLCRGKNRANAAFAGQNGRRAKRQPLVRPMKCGKGKRRDGAKRGR